MKVDSYQFGEIVIDGIIYTTDLVIASENIYTRWFRREGHAVELTDLYKFIGKDCKKLIIGTGAAGLCKVRADIKTFCEKNNITLYANQTDKAVEEFNNSKDLKHVVAAFHLTC